MRAKNHAFTLPEVLATMVLLGVILPAALLALSTAMQASASARHTAESVELAQMKLAEIALDADSSRFTGTGDFGLQWQEYRWESSFTTGDFGVYIVTVRVSWNVRSVERTTSLSTMVVVASSTASAQAGVSP